MREDLTELEKIELATKEMAEALIKIKEIEKRVNVSLKISESYKGDEDAISFLLSCLKKYDLNKFLDLVDHADIKVDLESGNIELKGFINEKRNGAEYYYKIYWDTDAGDVRAEWHLYLIEKCSDCLHKTQTDLDLAYKYHIKGSFIGYLNGSLDVDGKGGTAYWIPALNEKGERIYRPCSFGSPDPKFKRQEITKEQKEIIVGCPFAFEDGVPIENGNCRLWLTNAKLKPRRDITCNLIAGKVSNDYDHCKRYTPKPDAPAIGNFPLLCRYKRKKTGEEKYTNVIEKGTVDKHAEVINIKIEV